VRNWQSLRDVILFFAGLMGVFNEAVLKAHADPQLLLLYGAMLGLPAILRSDERKNGRNGSGA
jgi:hypothetical protein